MKILVIEAAGLHLGYLGCYGNDWVATPNLDRLAADGIVFDWHFADQPELDFTTPFEQRGGAGPQSVRPRVVRCANPLSFAADVLAALETDAPWVWIEGPSLLPPWKHDDELLDVYFDEDDVEEGLSAWRNPPLADVSLNDAEVLQLQNTYAAVVTAFDAQLGALLERALLDDTFICVTARSGLPLGEHGMIGAPRPMLHDELVHIPLVMRMPDNQYAGLRIGALTQSSHLCPTLLDALGPAAGTAGASLWPLLRGEKSELRSHAICTLRVGNEQRWLVRTADWAYHVSTPSGAAPQLFVKPDDRWEVNDLCQQQSEIAAELDALLTATNAKRGDSP
jgi:arylsulfatase A-like enzyme